MIQKNLVNEIITIICKVSKFSLNDDINFSITFIKEKHFSFEIQQRCVARNSEVEFLEKMKEMDDCNLLKKKILCIRKESRKVRKTYEIKMYCYIQHMRLKESSFFHTFFAKLNDMIMRPYFVGRRAILLNFLQNTSIMTSCMRN